MLVHLNVLAIVMAALVLVINVSAQHHGDPGHDPGKPSQPSIGQCCAIDDCLGDCHDVPGLPDRGTKHPLGSHCRSFSGAATFVKICASSDCSGQACSVGIVPGGQCVTNSE